MLSPGYALGTIAVNVTWIEKEFNAGRSMYPSIFNRFPVMSLKVVPFKSLGVVSYSPSTVTMAVSVAVCDIFSVKEWPDLENGVRVRSRSSEMAPIDRSHMSLNT